ncbi:ATP-binding cassette domain-containing protein [Rhizobium beringeri]
MADANIRMPIIEVTDIVKHYGSVIALNGVSMHVSGGEVLCLLGDNGAGKSTLIKTLSGVVRPSGGAFLVEGKPVNFSSPRDALDAGIATVYQDLAMIPLMSITRNFFMGREPRKGFFPFRHIDLAHCNNVTREEMHKIGIDIRDPNQAVGTLSGVNASALPLLAPSTSAPRSLILDEPTSALGVAQTSMVLKYIHQVRQSGLGVIFITHNVRHAYAVADRFHHPQSRPDAWHLW